MYTSSHILYSFAKASDSLEGIPKPSYFFRWKKCKKDVRKRRKLQILWELDLEKKKKDAACRLAIKYNTRKYFRRTFVEFFLLKMCFL